MLISYCFPCRNRAHDLKKVMPCLLVAAEKAPPVEIVILDYGSTDDLRFYVPELPSPPVRHVFYDAEHFHMAKARNLSMLTAEGEWLVSSNADTLVDPLFFLHLRHHIAAGFEVVRPKGINGVLAVSKLEFVKAGGFDEQFEFYGPEDKDLVARLERRGLRTGYYDHNMIAYIRTSNQDKVKNYCGGLSKEEMAERMHPIYQENVKQKTLVANPIGWPGAC